MPERVTKTALQAELERTRARLEEAEATLEAIRTGQVDALVVDGPEGQHVFTLQGADHRYRRIVETMTEGAAIIGADGLILYANARFAELLTRPLDRVLGSHLRQFVPPGSWPHYEPLLDDRRESAVGIETEVLGPGATTRPVHVSVAAGEAGLEGICLIVTDLSAVLRKREALVLRQNEQRFRTLAMTTSQIVWTADAAGIIREDSPSWRAFTGLGPSALVGGRGGAAVHPEDAAALESAWAKGITDAAPFTVELRTLRRDGVYRTMAVSAAPVLAADGTIKEWVGSSTDITERRATDQRRELMVQASTALASSFDCARTFPRVAEFVVPLLADACIIETCDETAESWDALAVIPNLLHSGAVGSLPMADASSTAAQGGKARVYSLLEAEDRAAFGPNPRFREAFGVPTPRSALVVPITLRGRRLGALTLIAAGTRRNYRSADRMLAEDLASRLGIALENARLYESERAARASADVSNRSKDEFLATISHELRTPLNAILGWARLLGGGQLPEAKRASAVEAIERNAVAQAQLIEDLLDVSRIVSGKMRLEIAPVNLLAVVHAAIETLAPASTAKGITVVLAPVSEELVVHGDANRLQQVVWNLLSNGVKFTPRGGNVLVSLRRVEGDSCLQVRDTGSGIAPAFVPHVFERFQQEDGKITRNAGGLGLGLAICRHLVELHGGTIDAQSDGEGRGATFTVKIPTVRESVEVRRAEPTPRAKRETADEPVEAVSGLKVLVVDDEEDARELVATVLRHHGAIVRTAGSVAQALAALDEEVPNVMISDIGMPGEDGYSLIGKVRKRPASAGGRIPVAAVTAYARAEDRQRALRSGFQLHLSKPAEPDELVALVSRLAAMSLERATS